MTRVSNHKDTLDSSSLLGREVLQGLDDCNSTLRITLKNEAFIRVLGESLLDKSVNLWRVNTTEDARE